MAEDEGSTDLVQQAGTDRGDRGEALVARAHMAAVLNHLAEGPAEEMELLARIDAALETCALATGGTGRQIREAWQAGVNAFLREP